jgi:deoxyribodipyrimidine photo-lyase
LSELDLTRLRTLSDADVSSQGAYVLYWMQQSQRASFNPALEYAIARANEIDRPVLVCFGLTNGYPEANARHYTFMLEGLAETASLLRRRGLGFVTRLAPPTEVAISLSERAALVVTDRGYLKPQVAWRKAVADRVSCQVVEVEGDVVVPVEIASKRHEVGARTLRPKLQRLLDRYLVDLKEEPVRRRWDTSEPASTIDLSIIPRVVAGMRIDHAVRPVRRFKGGSSVALTRFETFLIDHLARYAERRGVPEAGAGSHMSPYLHFGQISPVQLALVVQHSTDVSEESRATFLEELIVRRELAMNHVHYDAAYDTYEAVPGWARRSLDEHRHDPRPTLYDLDQLAHGQTHDSAWNAAMREMRETGYMHNHMRMYWGKKILEWSRSPEEGFDATLRLNNRYFLDGRDANSFTNVAWIYGLHDRPWFQRPIFGMVRYMSGESLRRKFDIDAYGRAVDQMASAEA